MSVFLSADVSQKPNVQTSGNFLLSEAIAQSFSDSGIHMYFGFVDVVMFSHNGLYGMWQWQYLHERHAGVSCHNFST